MLMQIKRLNNTAFSLLEILLAAVIFVISVAGVFATLSAVRGPVTNKENALTASIFGKQILDALYSQVTASTVNVNYYGICSPTCTTFNLYLGSHQVPVTDSSWPTSLSWPTALQGAAGGNTCAGTVATGSCLSYTVTCADGTIAGAGYPYFCSNGASVGHQVTLNISTP